MDRSQDVERIVREMYEALKAGDIETFDRYVSDSVLLIGTDPAEWWDGKEAAMRALREQTAAMGGSLPVRPGEPTAYEVGDLAWFAARPAFVTDEGEVECRHTGVFRREDGEWRLVESHISIGVPNEEAVGQELPT
jgi:ketosteroid isomerase-like protein